MNLCSDGHDEVAHEGRLCPACQLIDEHKAEVSLIQGRLDDMTEHRDALLVEVDELKSKVDDLQTLVTHLPA